MTVTIRTRSGWLVTMMGVLAGVISSVSANGGPPAPITSSVTSTVFDTDSSSTAVQLQSDGLPGSGSAVYTAADGVLSQIDSSGAIDWNLDLRNSTRGFYLTLTTPSGGAVPGLPVGPTFYPSGRIVSRCFTPAGGTTAYSWFNVSASGDPNCAMRVNFTSGSTSYTLVMSPLYSGTGLALVSCNAFSASSCVDWSVIPNPSGANAGVANLYSIARNGSEKFVAACRLTFRMHVTYP